MRDDNQVWLISRDTCRVSFLLLLIGLSSLVIVRHSTAKFEPVQVLPDDTAAASPRNITAPASVQVYNRPITTASTTTMFNPYIIALPSTDGEALYIHAHGISQLGGTFFANVSIGPGHRKDPWTLTYSDTVDALVATAVGFTVGESVVSSMSVTGTVDTQTFDTGDIEFNRAFVELSGPIVTETSPDNMLELDLPQDSLPASTYIVLMSSYMPPASEPIGHSFVSKSHSVRAAGALVTSTKPMLLRLAYNEATLIGADPHTLIIFAWDAYHKRWDNLGGRLFYDQQYLSVATSRFTTYALMSTPAWRDEFDDFNGLSFPGETHHVTLGGTLENRTLVLVGTATSGVAVSKPITPTTGFASWGSLTFTRTVEPPTTTLTVDVLSLGGTVVLTDVASGADLAGLDPAQYPALKLRASLSSTVVGETPALDMWRVTWQVEEHRVFLPVVLR